ncbi:Eco57I restriction-modification methylase domain-containing protein [Agrobacterium tumefaciens]|uniref:Eco57I restriction-modification methylase domain-containing protein n=1 Tax=Agrobacterium tumefaciens TaxID=358 RepID=UPI002AFDF9F4|nr:type IIL restriction-modification enzyme MmeI [Agrobacterium tumefaciens]MEA1842960.1 type IIL restriction-modification enzyme MmeI [Agrobacterium tumefaciens]
MAGFDPNEEWLGHVQPVGLVVAPVVLKAYELVPEQQTRSDSEAIKPHLSQNDSGPALLDPWAFFADILGWRPGRVAGSPGGAPIPGDLVLRIEESDIEIAPHWAVAKPDGGWQMLVRVEVAGVDPDGRGALEGWEATPHQRLERLCKDRGVPIGILVTDGELRLIYAPRGETSGWLRFPLSSLGEVGGRPMLGGLKLLLSSFRLHNDAPERRLPALLQKSRDEQAEVSSKLAAQVLGALHELMRGLHDADRGRMERLARERPEHVYDGLLTVLLRLVFLLYAEDRELIPSRTDAEARRLYDQGYGVRTLHARLIEDRARHELTMHLRRGAWSRLLTLFRLVHQGDRSGNWIRGRGGKLFDPSAFPFLQGQDDPGDLPMPAEVSDECVAKMLDRLLVLDGEKLSYRTLDVEQIGSVYETVMGFTVETMDGPALAIRAGKNDRTPVFLDLNKLLAAKPNDRAKFLKEEADRGKVTDKVGKTLKEAATIEELAAALTPIVDERASPGAAIAASGTPLLQPTDERRRTGSHYTPRSLTAPIVQHALEPAFERIGPDATAEDVLSLKVCDPAMGSGAFLVEACRALGDRLVLAWARWPQTRPTIPADEDEPLHARRLVAQRCLYGVDRNPRAVDLAKLSLWLATLARDHEFTFLDHALKCGDSLVGLDDRQIAAMHWDASKPGLPLFRKFITDRVTELASKRAQIQAAPDDTMRVILEVTHREVEKVAGDVRVLGDAVISAFFAEDKPKAREKRRAEVESWVSGMGEARWNEIRAAAESLNAGSRPLRPFHWDIEFPEVFARRNGGFDAFIGNPPYLGGTKISGANSINYFKWISAIVMPDGDKADLIAYFIRRLFSLLRSGGTAGLITTSSIAEGDTRKAALVWVRQNNGQIYRASKKETWPGEANVDISRIHIAKGFRISSPILDDDEVTEINSFLNVGSLDHEPFRLKANEKRCFEGFVPYGEGFVIDDRSDGASSEAEIADIVAQEPRSADVIFPYLGGEEVTEHPSFSPARRVIYLAQMAESEVQEAYPAIYRLLERKVRTYRMSKSDRVAKSPWWQFLWSRPALYKKMRSSTAMIVTSRVSKHHAFARVPTRLIPSTRLSVITFAEYDPYAIIQCRAHEVWARYFGASRGATANYSPSDCFETFPFPPDFESSSSLKVAGQAYHDFRASLMVENAQGMTKTYNRFHDQAERSEGIIRLRELHADMDRAVLEAYGWDDLSARAEPIFLDDTSEDDHTYQWRLFWPSEFRDEVLARLLALNAERAKAERDAGLVAIDADEMREEDEE